MVKFYVMMLKKGKIKFSDVPRKMKEPVREELIRIGREDLLED